jgi:hypothetical protein
MGSWKFTTKILPPPFHKRRECEYIWALVHSTNQKTGLKRCTVNVLLELLLFCKYIGKQCVICYDRDCSHSPPVSVLIGMASRHDGIHINTIRTTLFIYSAVYILSLIVRSFIWKRRAVYYSALCRWAGLVEFIVLARHFYCLNKTIALHNVCSIYSV